MGVGNWGTGRLQGCETEKLRSWGAVGLKEHGPWAERLGGHRVVGLRGWGAGEPGSWGVGELGGWGAEGLQG